MKKVLIGNTLTVMVAALLVTGKAIGSEDGNARRVMDSLDVALEESEERPIAIDSMTSLDDYLEMAARRSPDLRSAFYNWKAALEVTGYAGALPDPMLSYGYFVENVETRVGPQNHRIGFRQSYPWFGTLGARKDMATQAAMASYQKFEAKRLQLFYRVKSAYYDYYYLAQDIYITRDNLELLTFWESVARTKFKAALKQHPDVIRAQVELGKLEDRLLTLEDKVEPAAARLRAAIDLPDSIVLPLPKTISVAEVAVDDETALGAVLEHNPDLKSIRHVVQKEQAGIRLARKVSYPNFSVGVDYIETGEALNPASPESGKDPWVIAATINLPIWFGKNAARKREAVARHKQAQYNLVEAENRLSAFAEMVLFQHDDALRKVRLYRDGLVPKAEQSLNASYTAYQAGELDFLNVLDAQRQLLDFQLQLQRALADLGIKQAELEMITGKQINELAQ